MLTIIAILAATLLAGKNSSKRAGAVTAARAVGASYHDSIEAFMRDHGGRVPVWGPPDWPTAPSAATSGVTTPPGTVTGAWGPINEGARQRPYLDKIPEAVASGRVVLVNGGAATTDPGVRSRGVYEAIGGSPSRRYRLSVQRATTTGWLTTCEFGTEGGSQC